ncbi:MAG: hypothetical protein HXY43_06830 [Fischerella sp.]|uniref:hypothetical protein n=1 Tax=Fischerella sp. TaxID=1191 RepID=UPI0017AC68DF|nr:hypothetical protein [Fischerella sp.]NWF59014.1 hypothetical protein [Fischerella sp.]
MTNRITENIQTQLIQVLTQLPLSSQEEVLNFAISLHKKQKFQQWDAASDEEAAALKSEFADEDLAFAETALTYYLPQLQQEDTV